MFFWLSKVLWLVLSPSHLILLVLCFGAGLLFTRFRALGRWLVGAGTAVLLAIATLPVGGWVLSPLEARFPPVDTAIERVQGIVVLGGSINPGLSAARHSPQFNDAAERLTVMASLARAYPDARVLYAGGSGSLTNQRDKEADVLPLVLESMGVPLERVEIEFESRNTYENATKTLAIAGPEPGGTWLLVTSAFHMPRAVGCFRRAGWPEMVPYPVDFRFPPSGPPVPQFGLSGGLRQLDLAVHEWLGLVAYRLTDRTDSLYPGPSAGR